ncbi:chromate transporter [Solibaculum intestinale]|uniref:Chromate transporter n=1 Tax=Solibaculum intestinale TaxID=3133165 RepID=A0ABV1DY64_9FIRM
MAYLALFWSFFQIGLFSIGGGYAAMPLIQEQVVGRNGWLSLGEFADVVTLSQMTPGPIAINAATFVGIRVGGVGGAIVATLGCIAPSCIIVLILAKLYYKYRSLSLIKGVLAGLRPAVVALIAAAGMSILTLSFWGTGAEIGPASTDWVAIVLFAAGFFVLRKWKPNPIFVMLGAGALGGALYLILDLPV